jgi:hypothetical protein
LVSSNSSPFKAAKVLQTSRTDDVFESLAPIAWSPDSRWLVVEHLWASYGDAFGITPFIYDATARRVLAPDILSSIQKHLGNGCGLEYRSFDGFDSQNRLIVSVADWKDEEGQGSSCIDRNARWIFDPITSAVEPATF